MLRNSTGTVTAILVVTTIASSGSVQQVCAANNDLTACQMCAGYEDTRTSVMPITRNDESVCEFVRSMSIEKPIDAESVKMQQRYRTIQDSFSKYSKGFPRDKREYVSLLSNSVCRLHFVDNVSSYNEDDATIDTILKLSNGLKLSISQFLDEGVDAPAVFSIHRERTLLISDEMPIADIVSYINSIEAKLTGTHEA